MGIIKQGIMGGFSGNVGTVVGSSWKGISYMKSLPQSVKNPRSAGQVAQRTKMLTIVLLTQFVLIAWVQKLWNGKVAKMSGFNAFIRENIGAVSGSGVITPASMKVSDGPIAAVAITSAVYTAVTKTVEVVFSTALDGELQSDNDIAFVLIVDPTSKQAHASSGALRSTGTISLVLPDAMAPNALTSTVFLAFKSNEPLIHPIVTSDASSHAIVAA